MINPQMFSPQVLSDFHGFKENSYTTRFSFSRELFLLACFSSISGLVITCYWEIYKKNYENESLRGNLGYLGGTVNHTIARGQKSLYIQECRFFLRYDTFHIAPIGFIGILPMFLRAYPFVESLRKS
jgi:hypothetical protein